MTTTLDHPPTTVPCPPAVDTTPGFVQRFGDRIAFAVLLTGTGLLYLVGLSASGWANQFYAAAAQAGSKSWKAFLFGSLDSSNFITVDKPPAALWVMDASVKLFGLNSWSVLVPQAATTGDNEAATLELASNTAVMSLGGYNGTDPAIGLDAFKKLVAAGKVHYYIGDGQGFIGSTAADTSTAYAIQQWVKATFTAQTIGGTTVYDLTAPTS